MYTLAPEGFLGTRRYRRGELVRLRGFGQRMFRVRGIGTNGTRSWLETYGPVDRAGRKILLSHAAYYPVAAERVKCVVRGAFVN